MIATLAQLGADLSAKEDGGRTARDLALLNSIDAAEQILKVLAATTQRLKPGAVERVRGKISLKAWVEFHLPCP